MSNGGTPDDVEIPVQAIIMRSMREVDDRRAGLHDVEWSREDNPTLARLEHVARMVGSVVDAASMSEDEAPRPRTLFYLSAAAQSAKDALFACRQDPKAVEAYFDETHLYLRLALETWVEIDPAWLKEQLRREAEEDGGE